MINEHEPTLDQLSRRWGTAADDVRVKRTMAALEANGISALRAADIAEARRLVLDLIPDRSQVHHGASQSLELAGIVAEIETSGRYEPLARGSGAWIATPRPMRSAVCPPRRT